MYPSLVKKLLKLFIWIPNNFFHVVWGASLATSYVVLDRVILQKGCLKYVSLEVTYINKSLDSLLLFTGGGGGGGVCF